MFTTTDYDRLLEIMEESPEKKDLLSRLLTSHQMTLSTISHEIRNPLTLIYSTLQLIESQHPEVLDYKYWSDMHNDIDYTILLLNELSNYNNSNNLNLVSTDSGVFFKKLVLSFAASLIDTDIQFISQIAPVLPVIQCDKIKLYEAFLNLLGNARDAVLDLRHQNISKNNISYIPRISISVTTSSDYIHISLEDNGCGIPSDNLDNIFEPFITYKKNGTGLGLAITSRIIKAHKGTIQVSSTPFVGTTFTLTLPIKQDS